jgi:type II secretory pathway component PulF
MNKIVSLLKYYSTHLRAIHISFTTLSTQEQILFAKRLSFLIEAQIPLTETLRIIENQTSSKRAKGLFHDIGNDISSGHYLYTSLQKYQNIFGKLTINLIQVGENTGSLAYNLRYLVDELTKAYILRNKIRSALIYPFFIVLATLGVTSFLTIFIFPKIMPLFISLSIELPLTTRALLATSTFLSDWGIQSLICFVALIILFQYIKKTHSNIRHSWDRLILFLPICGTLSRTYNCASFCRTFGLLLQSGIPYTEALATTAQTLPNSVYRNVCADIARRSTGGEHVYTQLESFKNLFPEMLVHLIAVGERTGRLNETLLYLNRFYEEELDEKTRNLSTTIEPVLLMVMGLFVGTIATAIISPIYEITKNMQR